MWDFFQWQAWIKQDTMDKMYPTQFISKGFRCGNEVPYTIVLIGVHMWMAIYHFNVPTKLSFFGGVLPYTGQEIDEDEKDTQYQAC